MALAAAARTPAGGERAPAGAERVTRSSRGGQGQGGEEEEVGGLDDSEALKGREALLRKVPPPPRTTMWL